MIGNGAVRSFFRSIASFSVLVYTQPMAVIRISLDSSTSEKVAGIGGTGLDLAFALYDAFRESDPIVITPPSEEALRFSGCAFFTMVFRSPVTDSMMMQYSSLPPGYSLRRLGYDAVVITGRAEHFSYLSLSADDAEFLSAEGMRCTPSSVFETMARKNITDVFLSIGRAGENGILYASLQSGGHEAGGCGLGCVFGRKNLKGILLPGFSRKDSLGSGKAERRARRRQEKSKTARRIRKEGGGIFIDAALKAGWLPVDGYSRRYDPRAYFLDGKAMTDEFGLYPESCQECYFACGRRTRDNAMLPSWRECALFGSNLGFYSLSDVMKLSDAVREEGLGIADTGALLAHMKCGDISEYITLIHMIGRNQCSDRRAAAGVKAFPGAIAAGGCLPLLSDLRGDPAGAVLASLCLPYILPVSLLLPGKTLTTGSGAVMALYETACSLALVSLGYSPMGTISEWWGRIPRFVFKVPFLLRIAAVMMRAYGLDARLLIENGMRYMERLSSGPFRLPERFTMEAESDYGDGATIQYTRLMECYEREKVIARRIVKSRREKRRRPSSERSAAVGPSDDLGRDGDPGLQK